nr:hypothetical protein [Tanacetum cinerariifolium]
KVDEGFLVGYSVCTKAFRGFNSRTRIVQETLHVNFMENKPTVAGSGLAWLFDIDSLTQTMNYHPVFAENQTNSNAGFQDTKKAREEGTQTYVLFPMLSDGSTNPKNNNKDALVDGKEQDDDIQKSVSIDIHSSSCGDQTRKQDDKTENKDKGKSHVVTITGFRDLNEEFEECINNSSNEVNAAGSSVFAAGLNFTNSTNDFSAAGPSNAAMPNLEDRFHNAYDVGAEVDINNMESIISVSPILTTRIHKDHTTSQIIGDLSLTTQTRSMARAVRDQGGISQMFNEDFHTCMFACFLSQEEPKRKFWILVDLPYGKMEIGTKWVYRNKKDERGIVIRNKARLVAQGHTQEEGINYEEVFALVARIEAIRLFLAYASFMGFPVYQMDVKSAFLYVTIEEEVYVCKFKGNVDEGFLVGYSVNSKAFRVFNSRIRIVQETLHVNFLENKPNVAGTGPTWLFDIDSLTRTMNYQPVIAGNQSNPNAGFQEEFDARKIGEEANQQYMLFPVWSTGLTNPQNKEGDATFDGKEHDAEKPEFTVNLSPSSSALSREQDDMTKKKDKGKSLVDYFTGNRDYNAAFEDYSDNSSNDVSAVGPIVPTTGQNYFISTNSISAVGLSNTNTSPTHGKSSLQNASQSLDMLESEDIVYSDHENVGAEADFNNLETSITVSPIPTTRIHNAHPISQIIGNLSSTT